MREHTMSRLFVVVVGTARTDLLCEAIHSNIRDAVVQVVLPDALTDLKRAVEESHFIVASDEDPAAVNGVGHLVDVFVRCEADVFALVRRILAFETRRRSGVAAPDRPPILVESSARWVESAGRVSARIRNAFERSGRGVNVEHIGSTAVPGVPSRDVLDLLVTVDGIDALDVADRRLRDAGLVSIQHHADFECGEDRDRRPERGSSFGADAPRIYASADEGQQTSVRFLPTSDDRWRHPLLLRDWLRAEQSAREEYADVKAVLAALHETDANGTEYSRAKGFWFDRALREAKRWAQATGWSAHLADPPRPLFRRDLRHLTRISPRLPPRNRGER